MRDLEKTRRWATWTLTLYETFLSYLGYPQQRLPCTHLVSPDLQGEDRRMIRDFLGHRVALEIQKRVMLGYVSRLWIDYFDRY